MQKLFDFVALSGLMLRHLDREIAGDHVAFIYLFTMRNLDPKLREYLEKTEQGFEPHFLKDMAEQGYNKGTESCVSHVVETLYDRPGPWTGEEPVT
jgi:hypothetical protein